MSKAGTLPRKSTTASVTAITTARGIVRHATSKAAAFRQARLRAGFSSFCSRKIAVSCSSQHFPP
jgi:hypothetical protein